MIVMRFDILGYLLLSPDSHPRETEVANAKYDGYLPVSFIRLDDWEGIGYLLKGSAGP